MPTAAYKSHANGHLRRKDDLNEEARRTKPTSTRTLRATTEAWGHANQNSGLVARTTCGRI